MLQHLSGKVNDFNSIRFSEGTGAVAGETFRLLLVLARVRSHPKHYAKEYAAENGDFQIIGKFGKPNQP